MLRGTMLFRMSSMRIGTKVSNRCSIIVLAFLYPSCYPWRNCYFGRKCYVVEIWFCEMSAMSVTLAKCCDGTIFALAAKYHTEPHDVVRSSVACIKDSFLVLFFWISVVCVIRLFVSFLYYCVCFVMYFIAHAAFVRIKLMMMMIAPSTRRSRAHHRVNPYPGACRQNETEMFLDHDETSLSIAAVSAPSVGCSMLVKRVNCEKNERKFHPHSYTVWKLDASSFLTERMVGGERSLLPKILG